MDTVEFSFRLRCFVRRDGNRWASLCPRLDVASQGPTQEAAKLALRDALELWVESCIERDTLRQALTERGFRLAPAETDRPVDNGGSTVTGVAADEAAAYGKPFPVEIKIPAFIAARLNEEQHRIATG